MIDLNDGKPITSEDIALLERQKALTERKEPETMTQDELRAWVKTMDEPGEATYFEYRVPLPA